ncbi:uncharacterized protein [Dasypus novemcinctus]|uniref:uncharacterized protein n=1 Tax=Dasypus novemcinctus TaxID=9361 RepID=UPI00265FEAD8|nr:uncharacterized protein LOC131278185 [Dasypus novemcinctus]
MGSRQRINLSVRIFGPYEARAGRQPRGQGCGVSPEKAGLPPSPARLFPPRGHQVRQPDWRQRVQGIVGVVLTRGPRRKTELVSSLSLEHCERHNSFSCSEKTVACRRAASYRRGLVSAAAARPLPRSPAPPGSPARTCRARECARRRKNAPQRAAALRRRCRPSRSPATRHSLQGVVLSSLPSAAGAGGSRGRRWRRSSPRSPVGIFHFTRSTV